MKANRTRDCRAKIHFTEKELQAVDRKAKAAGLDRSKYIRGKLAASEVKPGPQADIPALIAVTRRAGQEVEDVLVRVNTTSILDVPAMRKALDEVKHTEEIIRDAFKEG